MRRRSSGFDRLFTDLLESNMGRLRTISNMWALVGSQWDKKRVETIRGHLERDGKVLVKRKCVHCPKPPGDDFAKTEKFWSVPWTECLKCSLHVKPGPVRFHRCGYKFENDAQAIVKTAVEVKNIQDKAMAIVTELMK